MVGRHVIPHLGCKIQNGKFNTSRKQLVMFPAYFRHREDDPQSTGTTFD